MAKRAVKKKPATRKPAKATKKPAPKSKAAARTKKKPTARVAKRRPASISRAKKAVAKPARKRAAPKRAAPKRAAARPRAVAAKRPPARSAKPAASRAVTAKKPPVAPRSTVSSRPVAAVAPRPPVAAKPAARPSFKPATAGAVPPAARPTVTVVAARPAGPKPLRIRAKPVAPTSRIAAPAGPPIDLAVVLAKLRAKKKEILALYLNDLRSGQESNDSPTEDIVDRANNAYSRELNFSISDAERALMLQVDEAIRRVENGSYTSCANCGNPIARPRLEAVPWARYCISCQELLEQGMLSES